MRRVYVREPMERGEMLCVCIYIMQVDVQHAANFYSSIVHAAILVVLEIAK